MYSIVIKASAMKALNKAPSDMRDRLWKAIHSLSSRPRPHGVKKLKHSPSLWRIRVGSYRIVYQIVEDRLIIVVASVGPRKDVYKNL